MTIFASAALLLAAIGLYAVIAYSVQQRTPEMGIRLALGAESRQLQNAVMLQGIRLIVVGVGIGGATAYGLSRFMVNLVFGVTAKDPAVFLAVPVLLTAVALLAVWLPARRVSRVDPVGALRFE